MTEVRRPTTVLLDAGGVFVLPDPERIVGAFTRAEVGVDAAMLPEAHYTAAARFHVGLDVEADWNACWRGYLEDYVVACGVLELDRPEVHRHLDSEFADAALWVDPIEASRDGIRRLAETGVRLGIVSNADGMMGARLAELELCQVGPGIGVEVECVIDSGNVGVMKPDRRIFDAALDVMGVDAASVWYVGDMPAIDVVGARRAGLHAVVIDPLDLHARRGYDRTASLAELADRLAAS
jgi:putative hydrolase of the HAD superfamily